MRFFIIFCSIFIAYAASSDSIKCKQHTIDNSCIKDGIFCIGKRVIITPPLVPGNDDSDQPQNIQWLGANARIGKRFNSVELAGKNCEYFPYDLKENFKSLEIIHVKSSNLQHLEPADMYNFHNLRELDVSENKLKTLKSELFENNPELEVINFSGNPLQHVGYNFLIPLVNLIDAKFFRCGCINMAQRGSHDDLMAGLRTGCKPTESMLINDIFWLTGKVEQLEVEIDKRDGKVKKVRCHVNKSNPRQQNCLPTGNYHPFDQRPSGMYSIYSENQQ